MPRNKMPAEVVVTATDRMTGRLAQMGQRLDKFGARARRIGRMASLGISAPAAAAGISTFRAAANFEESMNKVMALSSATGDEFDLLRNKAKELGSSTRFTASQVAEGMTFLAMAGQNSSEMLNSIRPSLNLATVAAVELGDASRIVTDIMDGFGLKTEELGRANDVLAETITSSNTNLIELSEAMKMLAPIAHRANISLEDSAAAVGALASVGVKGTMAGTGLRRVLSTLMKEGVKVESFVDLLRKIEEGAIADAKILEFFGERGGASLLALRNKGVKSLSELTEEIKNSEGATERMLGIMNRGAAAGVWKFASAVQGLQIAIADTGFLQSLTKMFERLAEIASGMSSASKTTLAWAGGITILLAALGPVIFSVGLFVSGIGKLAVAMPLIVGGFKLLGTVALALTSPFWAIWAAIGAVTVALGALIFNVGGFRTAVVGAVTDALRWVGKLLDKFNLLPRFLKKPLGLNTEFSGTPMTDHREKVHLAGLSRVAGLGVNENKEATVRVKFDNMPENARAEIETDGGAPVTLEQGWQMVY